MQILLQLKCVITLEVYCHAWPMGWGVCLCSAVRGLMAVTIGECWWSHAKGKRCSRRTGPSPLVSILMYSLPRNSKKLILSDSFPVTPGNVKYLAVSPFFQSHFRYVHILPFFFFFFFFFFKITEQLKYITMNFSEVLFVPVIAKRSL